MSPEALRLRAARPDDLPRLREIAEAAYARYVARIGRRPAPMDEDFGSAISEGRLTLAEIGGQVVGYVSARAEGRALHVDSIAVDPSEAGRGLGARLMADAEARARAAGLSAIVLYTNAAMHENIGLYEHLGFRQTGRRMEDGFDRIYFRKDLVSTDHSAAAP